MTWVLDANVLIALLVPSHVHHARVRVHIQGATEVATCPITQGAFVRLILREGGTPDQALRSLISLTSSPRHTFVADDVAFHDVQMSGVIGHRQVTDAYLAGLARHHHMKLATLDRGLAALHADVVTYLI